MISTEMQKQNSNNFSNINLPAVIYKFTRKPNHTIKPSCDLTSKFFQKHEKTYAKL